MLSLKKLFGVFFFSFFLILIGSQLAIGKNVLIDNGDGTITDRSSGLMWQKSEGASVDWNTAIEYCRTLTLGGHTDWRVPTIEELRSIHDPYLSYPQMNTTFFSGTNMSSFWSSTEYIDDYAWTFSFWQGVETTTKFSSPSLPN